MLIDSKVALSVTFLNRCNDFNGRHEDALILEERHRSLFTVKKDIHAGAGADKR